MISIEIKNAAEIIAKKKGRFLSKAIGFVGAENSIVEKVIADEIKQVLAEEGVEADITITKMKKKS